MGFASCAISVTSVVADIVIGLVVALVLILELGHIYIYIYMPHTSIGGQFRGFEIYRSRGKQEK